MTFLNTLAVACSFVNSPCAPSATPAPAIAFSTSAVSDQALAGINGKSGWTLSRSTLVGLGADEAKQAFRVSGDIGRTQMDVWWGTTGSELIATAVRDASSL